jgi:hypothetical protein
MKDSTGYEAFVKSLTLKDYVELKVKPLDFLFDEKGFLKIKAVMEGKHIEFDVQVRHPSDAEKPWDCKIGNFEIDKFCRTTKGRSGGKYKTLPIMLGEISKTIKKKWNAETVSYRIVGKEKRKK